MKRKYRDLNGNWIIYEKEPKQFIFVHPTCTDKSKFVPEASDNLQYNGNASGNDPQYDYADGKAIKGDMRFKLRKPGLDITEIDEFINTSRENIKKHLDEINETADEIKNALGTDETVSEV